MDSHETWVPAVGRRRNSRRPPPLKNYENEKKIYILQLLPFWQYKGYFFHRMGGLFATWGLFCYFSRYRWPFLYVRCFFYLPPPPPPYRNVCGYP